VEMVQQILMGQMAEIQYLAPLRPQAEAAAVRLNLVHKVGRTGVPAAVAGEMMD